MSDALLEITEFRSPAGDRGCLLPRSAVVEAPRPTIAQEAERRRPSSVDDDPFVQQAVEIFAAKVADVRTA